MNLDRKEFLESLIDGIGLNTVLCELAEICHEKAEHLRSSWQDEAAAKEWEKAANRVSKACSPVEL